MYSIRTAAALQINVSILWSRSFRRVRERSAGGPRVFSSAAVCWVCVETRSTDRPAESVCVCLCLCVCWSIRPDWADHIDGLTAGGEWRLLSRRSGLELSADQARFSPRLNVFSVEGCRCERSSCVTSDLQHTHTHTHTLCFTQNKKKKVSRLSE